MPAAVSSAAGVDQRAASQSMSDPHARTIESVIAPAVTVPTADLFEEDVVTEPVSVPKRQGLGWPKLAAVAALAIIVTGGFVARRYLGGAPAPATTGTLTVTTNPAGATIAIDGEARGTTPLTLTLSPGTHQIQLQGGGDPRTLPVTITAGAEATQYVELPTARATGGQLMVKTDPAGAQVTVDGVARGESPITVTDLTPGEHAVSLVGSSGSNRQTVTIERGATASLVVSLASTDSSMQSGWISVTSKVEVQLFEKNRLLGTSATDQIMVASGRHDIDFVNEPLGYRVTRTIQVPPGKVAAIGLDLPKGQLAVNAVPWAEVWIDGEKAGDTPIGNLLLTIGPHDILFRHPDLGEQHQTAMVTLKGAGRLSVDLRKK
jgi:hypothetical protein